MHFLPLTSARVLAISTLLIGGVAVADTLSDYQYAVRQTGCASLPYSDLKSACVNRQRDVDDFCKGRGRIGCDDLGSVPGLNKNIAGIESKLTELQRERKDQERALASTSDAAKKCTVETEIKEIDQQIADLQSKIATLREQAKVATDEIERRIEIVKSCVAAREDVQKIFDKASTQAAAETDADVIPLASQLRDDWTESGRTHDEAVTSYQAALFKCQQRLP